MSSTSTSKQECLIDLTTADQFVSDTLATDAAALALRIRQICISQTASSLTIEGAWCLQFDQVFSSPQEY